LGVRGSPAVSNGMVYVTGSSLPDPDQFSSSGTVAAYDAAGIRHCSGTPKVCSPLWSVNDLGPIFSPPAVARGNVYVNVFVGDLHVLNAITGTKRWTDLTGHHGDGAPTVANDVAYVTDAGTLDAFDADGTTSCSGTPRTCTPMLTLASGPESSTGHEAAVANGTVFIGGSNALRAFRLHG
jgi:outer membrane protein assembly factor BamB